MIKRVETIKGVTYLNQRRFEASISNYGIRRQKRIETRNKFRIFDAVLVISILFLLLFLAIETLVIFKEKLEIMAKDRDIKYLESTLDKIVYDNDNYYAMIRKKVDPITLKRIAYIDLGMISPTENNIIYFDKSDTINVPIS